MRRALDAVSSRISALEESVQRQADSLELKVNSSIIYLRSELDKKVQDQVDSFDRKVDHSFKSRIDSLDRKVDFLKNSFRKSIITETYTFDLASMRRVYKVNSGSADYDTGKSVNSFPSASISYWSVDSDCGDESILPPYLRSRTKSRTWLIVYPSHTENCLWIAVAVTYFPYELAGDSGQYIIEDRTSGPGLFLRE